MKHLANSTAWILIVRSSAVVKFSIGVEKRIQDLYLSIRVAPSLEQSYDFGPFIIVTSYNTQVSGSRLVE
jgi:hypothetical protein